MQFMKTNINKFCQESSLIYTFGLENIFNASSISVSLFSSSPLLVLTLNVSAVTDKDCSSTSSSL